MSLPLIQTYLNISNIYFPPSLFNHFSAGNKSNSCLSLGFINDGRHLNLNTCICLIIYFFFTFTVDYQAIKGISTILSTLFYDFLAWHWDWQALLDYKGPKKTAPLPSMYRKSALVARWPLFIAHLWVHDMWAWLFLMSDRLWKKLKLAPTCRPAHPWQNGQSESRTTGWMRAVWTVSPPAPKLLPFILTRLSYSALKIRRSILCC